MTTQNSSTKPALGSLWEKDVSPRPWRIDKDNSEGLEIVAANGDLVFIEDFGGIPSERGASFVDQLIANYRANFHRTVEIVNVHDALVEALGETLRAMRALRGCAFIGSHVPREQEPLLRLANGAEAAARAVLEQAEGRA